MRTAKSLETTKRERKMRIGDNVQRGMRVGRIIKDGRYGDWIIRWSDGRESGCFEHDLKLDAGQSDFVTAS